MSGQPAIRSDEELPPVVGGRWEPLCLLARGGMADVYIARHRISGQRCALKLLHHPSSDQSSFERFVREARAAADIGHEDVARVFDADCDVDTGRCFIAMELLEGSTLRDHMDDEQSTPRRLLSLIHRLLDPLAAAHQQGVVHRDLKPANVFVTEGDRVKLLDFGIARSDAGAHLTQPGMVMGTPHYMSPEQATDSRNTGPHTDVWAVGVMMYEAVAGHPPFDADTVHGVIVAACTRDHLPLCDAVPDVDPRLSMLVDRCLAKDPGARPRDAASLVSELGAVLSDNSIPASRIPSLLAGRGDADSASSSGVRPLSQAPEIPGNRGPFMALAGAAGAVGLGGAIGSIWLLSQGDVPSSATVASLSLGLCSLIGAVSMSARPGRREPSIAPRPVSSPPDIADEAPPVAPRRGPDNPAVTITVFEDVTNPHARRGARLLDELLERFAGCVGIEHRLRPRAASRRSLVVAEALREAFAQGKDEAFFRLRARLLAEPRRSKASDLLEHMRAVGLNRNSSQHALASNLHEEEVRYDVSLAQQAGVEKVPTLIIDGRTFSLDTPRFVIWDLVEALMGRAQSPHPDFTSVASPAACPKGHVRLRQILVKWTALECAQLSVPRSRAEAAERARRLLSRARDEHTDFSALAQRFSDGAIELGSLPPGALPAPLRHAVHRLEVGAVSDVLATDEGFHILQRTS